MNAVLSAANVARIGIGELAEIAADDVGLLGGSRRERAELQARRQAGRPRQLGRDPAVEDDEPERRVRVEKRVETAASSFDGGASLNSVDAIGEMLVKRHSSSRTDGNPSSTKREAA